MGAVRRRWPHTPTPGTADGVVGDGRRRACCTAVGGWLMAAAAPAHSSWVGCLLGWLVWGMRMDGCVRPSQGESQGRAGRLTGTHTHTPVRQKTKKDLVVDVCAPAGAANAGAQYRRARPSYGWLRSTRLAHGILSRSSITGVRRWEAPGHSQARRGWSWNRGDECPGRVLQLPPGSSGSGSIACACVLSVLGSQ